MRPPARAVRATSGEDLRLSMMPQRRSIDEESTLPELLGCLQHGGATLPTIDFWRPLDNKSRAAQRGLGTARNGANRVEVRVRAQISIKYEFIRSHGGRPRVRTQLTMMTPQGMRVVAFRPDHRSRRFALMDGAPVPQRASRCGGSSRYLRTGGLVLRQVGTAFVTPTEGQLYDPTEGAVTVPTDVPDVP